MTVRAWLSNSTLIGPRSDDDVLALAEAFPIPGKGPGDWEACTDAIAELRGLHLSAGMRESSSSSTKSRYPCWLSTPKGRRRSTGLNAVRTSAEHPHENFAGWTMDQDCGEFWRRITLEMGKSQPDHMHARSIRLEHMRQQFRLGLDHRGEPLGCPTEWPE